LQAALAAEGGELLLADDVGGEAVGVGLGLALGIGEDVDFAVCLFEGLADPVIFEPAAPTEHGLDRGADGMPLANGGGAVGLDDGASQSMRRSSD
jgi:hypothetical protein